MAIADPLSRQCTGGDQANHRDAPKRRGPQGALTDGVGARTLDSVEVRHTAYKHGKSKEDIEHAFRNALRLVEYEYHGEERLLVIGPARDGSMLGLVAVPADDPDRIIHADDLYPEHYVYLN